MNILIDVFLRSEDQWSVAVNDVMARLVFHGDTPLAVHWQGADGRQRAIQTLREAADQLEAL